ncbi:TPA: hypothetical protein MYJ36_002829 [Klebsiella quasipneumoniae]|nr:hypothetical protein [Klebsiella quasipneumoniae]
MTRKPSEAMDAFIIELRKKRGLSPQGISAMNRERLDGLNEFKRDCGDPRDTKNQAITRLTRLKKTLEDLAQQLDDMPAPTWIQMTYRLKEVSKLAKWEGEQLRYWAEAAQDGIDAINANPIGSHYSFTNGGRKANPFASLVAKKVIRVYVEETGEQPSNTEPTSRDNTVPTGFFAVLDEILKYYGVVNADVWYLTRKNK